MTRCRMFGPGEFPPQPDPHPIYRLRVDLHRSLGEAARGLGVSEGALSDVEHNRVVDPALVAHALALYEQWRR
jgi:hypothetical protein